MAYSERKLSHLTALDGVRGIAALMVMVFHYWQGKRFDMLGIPVKASQVAVFGQTGVDLFFVLSGFLITRILIFSKDESHYFRNFYGRRALRILPLYYFFLIFILFIFPLIDKSPIEPFYKTWWFWCYLQNIPQTFTHLASAGPSHYWSLAVEEHFYMLWPLIVFLAPVRSLARLSTAIIVAAIVCRAVFILGFKIDVFYFTLCRMDSLAFGALLACLEATGKLGSYRKLSWITLAVLLPPLIFAWTKLTGSGAEFLQIFKFSIIGLIYAAGLCLIVGYKDSVFVTKFFANPALRKVGQVSYGLYIYHGVCFYLVDQALFLPPIVNLVASFALSWVVSWLSFRFFEAPILRLKHFFPMSSPKPAS